MSNKQKENNHPKIGRQRVTTCSSQKSSLTPNDDSFMSNINSGSSQFVNPKKRQHDEEKTKHLNVLKVLIPLTSIVFLFICFSYNICR
jgi:hypothetical protein